jgi:hypothetical protein
VYLHAKTLLTNEKLQVGEKKTANQLLCNFSSTILVVEQQTSVISEVFLY